MKSKWIMMAMMGALFLSFLPFIAQADPGGLPACATNLAVCSANLTNAQASLTKCQATLAQCIQKVPFSPWDKKLPCDTESKWIPKASFPSWDKKLPCDTESNCPRFEVVLHGAAVLDNETGLVWEKSPSTSCYEMKDVIVHCADLDVGGRKGWHLPTVEQLASLVDTSVASSPKLPSGHPFMNVLSDGSYYAEGAIVRFSDGIVVLYTGPGCTDGCCGTEHVWCVRGGQGVNPQ